MILNSQQKVSLFFLSIFTLLIFGMWMAQFNQIMERSLGGKVASNESASKNDSSVTTSANLENIEMDATKSKDTDKDGLSDWDELYIYKTSPYIEDSDSDGYTDGQEVKSGKDPNCPTGQYCGGGSVYEDTSEQQAAPSQQLLGGASAEALGGVDLNNINAETLELLQQSSGQVPNIDVSNIENLTEASLQNILSGKSDAATLRNMLMSAGVDANMLNQMSDEDLMNAYNETLAQ